MKKLLLIISLIFISGIPSLYAHDVVITANAIKLVATDNTVQFQVETGLGFEEWDIAEESSMNGFKEILGEEFEFKNKNIPCELTIESVINNSERNGMTDATGVLQCTQKVEKIEDVEIRSTIFQDISSTPIDTYITLQVGEKEQNIILSQANPVFFGNGKTDTSITEKQTGTQTEIQNIETSTVGLFDGIRSFIIIGIEHIIFGADHVLFLIALILVVTSYRQILILISGFTVGHSVTLILAGLGLLQVSSKIVEPIIALSIVLVAGYNLYILYHRSEKKINIRERLLVTFGFGLFHGLGFAGSLADTVIPREFLFSSLIAFNVGIELGQILIIAIAAPAILYLLKQKGGKSRNTLLVIALILTVLASYWFIERILL